MLLKSLGERVCKPLSDLNMSLIQGIVPDAIEIAKVIPIYKAKNKELFYQLSTNITSASHI